MYRQAKKQKRKVASDTHRLSLSDNFKHDNAVVAV
jgi:hypothetical protein